MVGDLARQDAGVVEAAQHEVAELAAAAVEGPQVPAQAAVSQGEGHDLAGGEAAGQGAVGNLDGCAPVDGACQGRKQFQVDPARQAGAFGGDNAPKTRRLGIAVALGQPCEDPLDREVEQGPEPRGSHVDLALGVVLHVARGQFLVLGNVPRSRRRLDIEARDQILTADFAHEAQAQLDEREPVALRLRHS